MGLNRKQSSDGDNSSIEVDVNSTAVPSIPPWRIQQLETSPKLCASEEAIQYACRKLASIIHNDDSYDDIRRSFDLVFFLVRNLLSEDKQFRGRLASEDEYQSNVKDFNEDNFVQLLKDAAKKKNWDDLFHHEVFLKPNDPSKTRQKENGESINAMTQAWSSDFKGDSASVLLATISDHLNKEKKCYARFTSIVNSSGTGKSRMIDEISRKIITVPICLREDKSGGFPPPDATLCTWLLSAADLSMPEKAAQQLHAFVYALLSVTHQRLVSIEHEYGPSGLVTEVSESCFIDRQEKLASDFRRRMTEGQTFHGHNSYRVFFYEEVIEMAQEFMQYCGGNKKSESKHPRYVVDHTDLVEVAGHRLCQFIDPHNVLDSNEGPRRPLVIISVDESCVFTDNPRDTVWILFSLLRRAFREIVDYPIFSLFLSTAGRLDLSPPEQRSRSSPSSRIVNLELHFLPPICEISFDDVAFPASENTVSLRQVVGMDWICHLGRPLFGTRYDALAEKGREEHIMDFAQQKLLCGESILRGDNVPGILACLAVRFALEFNTDGASRAIACQQVKCHMRLCLAANHGLKKLVTTSPSEPLLAEAARDLFQHTGMDPIDHLAHHLNLNCIDLGRRGELVAAFVLMQARDKAAKEKRWMSVSEFMKALFPSAYYKALQSSTPTLWLKGERKTFSEAFNDYGMWFNHVIRVDSFEMLSADNLWKYITRGAMVVCKESQFGVDIVLPVCLVDQELSRDTVTAIYFQVRNNKKYERGVDQGLLNVMDPFLLGLFSEGQRPRPIIRVVFALTSQENGVLFPNQRTLRLHHPDKFTAFDIWCGGLSSNTFNNIGEDPEPYRVLLERSLRPSDTFDLNETNYPKMDPVTKDKRRLRRRKMTALVRI